jgi:hypothetical protein
MKDLDLKGVMPESWCCVDCGINTAPGFKNRAQAEQAFAVDWNNQGFTQKVNEFTEVYTIKAKVWQAAGMDPMGGCLCIGCREADRTAAGGQGLRTQAPVQFAARHRSVAVAPRCVMTAARCPHRRGVWRPVLGRTAQGVLLQRADHLRQRFAGERQRRRRLRRQLRRQLRRLFVREL